LFDELGFASIFYTSNGQVGLLEFYSFSLQNLWVLKSWEFPPRSCCPDSPLPKKSCGVYSTNLLNIWNFLLDSIYFSFEGGIKLFLCDVVVFAPDMFTG
jgi:hypothetical protein